MKPNLFEEILRDNVSGSGKILSAVQHELLTVSPKELTTSSLLKQLHRLETQFPHFALLYHFINAVRDFLDSGNTVFALQEFIRKYRSQWEHAQQQAACQLLNNLSLAEKNILLHSNSSAVHTLFRIMAERKMQAVVWQTVSSPVREGLLQSRYLATLGFEVHVFHEDAVSRFIQKMDMAIFGADLIWNDAFLNKVGTLPVCLLFREFQKPVYVLSESRKQIDRKKIPAVRFAQFIHEQPKPAFEIYPDAPSGVIVHNSYFEEVPLHLVTRVFDEKS
jgi:translation initiation factor 2B subunit (eIF-2B alpha/beta/delta family)